MATEHDWRADDVADERSNNLPDGTRTFEGDVIMPDATWSVAGIGDFAGSAADTILWRQNSGAVTLDSSWSIVEIGNISGIGDDDILWRQSSTSTLAMWADERLAGRVEPGSTYPGAPP